MQKIIEGRCELCGAKTGPYYTNVYSDLYKNHPCTERGRKKWEDVDPKCLDYIGQFGSMTREEVKAVMDRYCRENPHGA
jgi:hypothetical protein